jgi:hypothetical protein
LSYHNKNSEDVLKLGVHGLRPAEAGLVRALLSLRRGAVADSRWMFVDSGPCDALVADVHDVSAPAEQERRGSRSLLLLGEPGAGAPGTVARPLRPDLLDAFLARAESALGPPPHAPVPAGPAVQEPVGAERFKLRRWPPPELLRAQPARLRMATLLSRRALSPRHLATLTSQSEDECRRFILLLQGFRLLEPVAPASVPPPAPRPAGGWDIVRSIRRRLGL